MTVKACLSHHKGIFSCFCPAASRPILTACHIPDLFAYSFQPISLAFKKDTFCGAKAILWHA